MRVFISYSLRDAAQVGSLHEDLIRLGHIVWRDTDIAGGQEWWAEICEQIRACELFIFAFSSHSVRSRYCMAELEFALSLGRSIIPVNVTNSPPELAPPALRSIQHVPYTERSPEAVLALARAVAAVQIPNLMKNEETVLTPSLPLSDLEGIRDEMLSPELSVEQQHELLNRLRSNFDLGEDVIVELLRTLRSRSDLPKSVVSDLDSLLEESALAADNKVTGRLLVKALLTHVKRGRLMPILGSGLTEKLTGSRKHLAQKWAKSFEFPMSAHLREGLPEVAQFIKVMAGDVALRDSFRDYLQAELEEVITRGSSRIPSDSDLDSLFVEAWHSREDSGTDPHTLLARLPCPIYVTANPSQLLEHALIREGKRPRSDICRWRSDMGDWPESPFRPESGSYIPSALEPMVFHVFGRLDVPDSLVLTEDDYFEFLVSVTEDRTRIPTCIRRSLADSALLILGLQFDDWEFRILWRALVHQEGSGRLSRYRNVAAQVDLAGSVISPAGAREYLKDYFSKVSVPSLDIYWGSVDDFVRAMTAESQAER